MQSGAARGNGDGVRRLRAEHVARGRRELAEHERRGVGGRRLQMLARRHQRALERCGKREAAQPRFERLEATPVVPGAHRGGGQERFRGAHDEPEREQPLALRATRRFGDQRDEPFFGGRSHATSCCTAAATWAGTLSTTRSEEHTAELQSQAKIVCRLLVVKKKKKSR